MLLLLLAFLATGLLTIGLSLPLLWGKVAPNLYYGFRTPSTVRDPEIWYPANRACAAYLLIWGVLMAMTALGSFFLPGMGEELFLTVNLTVILGGAIVVVALSFLSLRRILRERGEIFAAKRKERRRHRAD